MSAQREVVVCDRVPATSCQVAVRQRYLDVLPPDGIAGEVESPDERFHVCHWRPERLGNHAQRRNISAARLVVGIFQPEERKLRVDVMELRYFLVTVGNLDERKPSLGSQRFAYRIILLRT